jgi:hypothetical protein
MRLVVSFKWIYIVSFSLFALLMPYSLFGQDEMVRKLVDMGFENVSFTETEDEKIYILENTAYRLNGVGIGKALQEVGSDAFVGGKACRLIFLSNNVPQISLYCRPSERGDSISVPSMSDWDVSYDLGPDWRKYTKGKKQNSSLFKVDIVVYPEVSLKNLVITQIYQVLFNLSPAIEVSLWKGMMLTAQMVFPVYNDGYGKRAGKVHPGFLTARQSVRLPYNTWGTLTVGMFNSERYGVDLKLFHPFKNEKFSVEGRVGVTSAYRWDKFELTYGTKKRLTWSVGGSYYWPHYNTQFTLKAEQYLLGEKGVCAEVVRHFRYCSIGFYALKAEHAKKDGGFRFQIALPPYKYKRRGYIPRITPSKNIGLRYDAGNEQYYYKTYRSAPGDNIMQANSFNPYYIKSELLNY